VPGFPGRAQIDEHEHQAHHQRADGHHLAHDDDLVKILVFEDIRRQDNHDGRGGHTHEKCEVGYIKTPADNIGHVGDGQALGAEFELRQSMGFISESLQALRINVNLTYNSSSIQMSETEYESRVDNARVGEEIEEYRTMAGMAPYLVNAGLYYTGGQEGFSQRLEGGFYYNVQGSTLAYVGVADRPDIYTEPFQSLNFNASIKLGERQKAVLGIKVENILNEDIELVYKSYNATDQYFERRSPGILTKLKLSYSF